MQSISSSAGLTKKLIIWDVASWHLSPMGDFWQIHSGHIDIRNKPSKGGSYDSANWSGTWLPICSVPILLNAVIYINSIIVEAVKRSLVFF